MMMNCTAYAVCIASIVATTFVLNLIKLFIMRRLSILVSFDTIPKVVDLCV